MMQDVLLYFFGIIFVLLAVGAVVVKVLGGGVKRRLDTAKYDAKWRQIEGQLRDGSSGRQLAVVNADKLLDAAMQELGFRGKTMGERLKNYRTRFSDNNGIWEAHKLRNRIAHETDVHVNEQQALRALAQLKRGLKDLGAL
ncbi:hypothetical protein JNJ66_02020 [Candidatus Saccharibacteria bacterium]|nr:hypothetical protein [Candidatus Saccharibacteria bacterium]